MNLIILGHNTNLYILNDCSEKIVMILESNEITFYGNELLQNLRLGWGLGAGLRAVAICLYRLTKWAYDPLFANK